MLSLKMPQLLRVHQVPRVFWEEGIMSGYRCPTSSALDCVLSSFQMTNETVNIWTHFLPTWFPELEYPGFSKALRTAAFAYPFLFDNLPLFYRLRLCWGGAHSCGRDALSSNHGYHLLCALLSGFLFAARLPERLAPGRFDYIGHSHQLFHICAVCSSAYRRFVESPRRIQDTLQTWRLSFADAHSYPESLRPFCRRQESLCCSMLKTAPR